MHDKLNSSEIQYIRVVESHRPELLNLIDLKAGLHTHKAQNSVCIKLIYRCTFSRSTILNRGRPNESAAAKNLATFSVLGTEF